MKTLQHTEDMPRGGARIGAGRPELPERKRRKNQTMKMLDSAHTALKKLAKDAKSSQGGIIEWFALSPEAKPARDVCVKHAGNFDAAR